MKAVILGVLSLGAVAFASSAWADHHHDNGGGGNHESHQSHGGGGGGHESHSSEHMSFHGSGGSSHSFVHEHASGHHESVHVTVHHGGAVHHTGHVAIHAGGHGHISVAHFHHVFRAPHRYRIGFWHAPFGFHYRRFGIGERIPGVLLVPAFFLVNYYDYGLDEPDDGYVWVRDGDDAVLVDRYTGEVVEVEYDVFY